MQVPVSIPKVIAIPSPAELICLTLNIVNAIINVKIVEGLVIAIINDDVKKERNFTLAEVSCTTICFFYHKTYTHYNNKSSAYQ